MDWSPYDGVDGVGGVDGSPYDGGGGVPYDDGPGGEPGWVTPSDSGDESPVDPLFIASAIEPPNIVGGWGGGDSLSPCPSGPSPGGGEEPPCSVMTLSVR